MLIYALLALAAHAGLWYATLPYRQSHLVGKGGIEDKAINVEIVSLKGLFAAGAYSPRAKVASSAKERKLDSDLGGEDEIAAADAGKTRRDRDKESSETAQQKPRSDPIGEVLDKDRQAAADTPAAVPRPPVEPQTRQPPEANRSPTPPQPDDKVADRDRVQPDRSQKSTPSPAPGGTASRSMASERAAVLPSAARAAASRGIARKYGLSVLKALRQALPRATSKKGTVHVKFAISRSGKLTKALIVNSSGSKALDDRVLDALKRVAFPVPPPTLRGDDLFYDTTYTFK